MDEQIRDKALANNELQEKLDSINDQLLYNRTNIVVRLAVLVWSSGERDLDALTRNIYKASDDELAEVTKIYTR